MRFTIDADNLRHYWQILCGVLPARTTQPVYQSILVDNYGEQLGLTASDTEIESRYVVGLDLMKNDGKTGSLLLPGQQVLSILRECSGDVTVELLGKYSGLTTITTESGVFELPTENADSFGKFEAKEPIGSVELSCETVGSLLSSVVFAAAQDEGKYAMRGVYLNCNSDGIDCVATDGKRLAVASAVGTVESCSGLIPQKAAGLATKMAADDSAGTVLVSLGVNHASFVGQGWGLTTRLVEGRFPPYRDVVPKKAKSTTAIKADDFARLVRAATVMTDDESKRVNIKIDNSGAAALSAQGATRGKAAIRGKVAEVAGDPVSVAVDPKYLLDGLKAAGDAELIGEFNGDSRPMVFRSNSMPGLQSWLYLVVPLT